MPRKTTTERERMRELEEAQYARDKAAQQAHEKANGRGPGRPARTSPPMDESNRERFTRIAEPRVNKVLAMINTIGKLASGKSKYDYNDADVEAIRATLIDGVNKMAIKLRREAQKPGFTFGREGKSV